MGELDNHCRRLNPIRFVMSILSFLLQELFNALVAMDELMGSNEINMRIAAMTPAGESRC